MLVRSSLHVIYAPWFEAIYHTISVVRYNPLCRCARTALSLHMINSPWLRYIPHHQRVDSARASPGREKIISNIIPYAAVLVQLPLHMINSPWFRYIPHHQRRQRIAREEEEENQQQQQLQQLQEQACHQHYVYESNYYTFLNPG